MSHSIRTLSLAIAMTAIVTTTSACAQGPIRDRIRDRIAAQQNTNIPEGTTYSSPRTIRVGGEDRRYNIYVPPRANGDKYGLLFAFHGFGSNAEQQEIVGDMKVLADRDGMIVVYPEGISNSSGGRQFWRTQANQDRSAEIAFVRAMLRAVRRDYTINDRRIFATGISNGGGMANMVAGEMSGTFAAIAPVAGAYYDYEDYNPTQPVAVMAFHGLSDRIVPIRGRAKLPNITQWSGYWAGKNGCATSPRQVERTDEFTWQRWGQCNAPVNLISIDGEGHTWPGSQYARRSKSNVETTRMMFDFFRRNPKHS